MTNPTCISSSPRKRRRLFGFSLVEVMVANALFLITIVGVTSATRTLTAASAHQEHMTMALHLSEFTMEELLLRFGGAEDLATGVVHRREFSRAGERVADGEGFYTATWDVTSVAAVANLKRISLTMSWDEGDTSKSFTLVTNRP